MSDSGLDCVMGCRLPKAWDTGGGGNASCACYCMMVIL